MSVSLQVRPSVCLSQGHSKHSTLGSTLLGGTVCLAQCPSEGNTGLVFCPPKLKSVDLRSHWDGLRLGHPSRTHGPCQGRSLTHGRAKDGSPPPTSLSFSQRPPPPLTRGTASAPRSHHHDVSSRPGAPCPLASISPQAFSSKAPPSRAQQIKTA